MNFNFWWFVIFYVVFTQFIVFFAAILLTILTVITQKYKEQIFLYFIIGIILQGIIFVLYLGIAIRNRFSALEENLLSVKQKIDIALKKRKDLIENLINTIKNYTNYERELILEIGEIRSIDKIKNYIERYPKLKSSKEFLYLMDQIYFIETEIASLRYLYNNIVQEFNTLLETFPYNIIGKMMNLKKLDYLNLDISNSFKN